MDEERGTFLEDGSQFGVSAPAFKRLRRARKRELMLEWFFQRFEDPAERTPHDEGEYVWIWGGPYDAAEQIEAKFGHLASQALMDDVVNEIEWHGTEWAPVSSPDDYDPPDFPDEPISLDVYSNEPSDRYGSEEDLSARAQVREALDKLRAALNQPRPIGIGHNMPPEGDELKSEGDELKPAIFALKAEFSKPKPDIARVKKWTTPIRDMLVAIGKWTAEKANKGADSAIKVVGAGIGAMHTNHAPPRPHSSAALGGYPLPRPMVAAA